MSLQLLQAPRTVVMVRPHCFQSNPETLSDNAYQKLNTDIDAQRIAHMAKEEFDRAAARLRAVGITVHLFDDYGEHNTPDSVFPNNWFSTHHGGRVAIYPMFSPNRRRERRGDIIAMLKEHYRVQEVIDYSGLEVDQLFLEGTGAMVMDHSERVAYVARSNRADPLILERFCTTFGYEPMAFDAIDHSGSAIYHTNVMMGIGTHFALLCAEMIIDKERREEIILRLTESGKTVITISQQQVQSFAGNIIELTGDDGTYLVLSKTAFDSLSLLQKEAITAHSQLLPLDVPTIELAGGSVRCMIAGIHLKAR